ncbi:MAG: hypothetical protein QNJ53_20220 [Pleurocapsa sp. MO_192.B19]|nr:hypothetical protein [Pleurocapsa sp. MO_192.B19]
MTRFEVLDLNPNKYLKEVDVSKQCQVNGGTGLEVKNSITVRPNGSYIALNSIVGDLANIDSAQLNLELPHAISISAEDIGVEILQTNQIITA